MNNDKDFSLEESEELINNLKSNASPELEKLRSTLNLLSHVHELSPISSPPVLPSEINHPVQLLTRRPSKTRRSMITSILSVGILASATLAAAAVTGRGPAPIVSAGHQSAKIVKAVAGAITDAVTGKSDDSPAKPSPAISNPALAPEEDDDQGDDLRSEDSEHSLTGPSSLPTSKGDDRDSDSDDGEDISPSITASPEPSTIKPSGIPKPTAQPEDDDEEEGDDD
ncbi:MAG: hypothetical protein Q8K86_08475 [Candidatus Nanopelagicaceae bacterium]|nr:hypothetical protein [Candidatus Nanopelagicaceae bacterium]